MFVVDRARVSSGARPDADVDRPQERDLGPDAGVVADRLEAVPDIAVAQELPERRIVLADASCRSTTRWCVDALGPLDRARTLARRCGRPWGGGLGVRLRRVAGRRAAERVVPEPIVYIDRSRIRPGKIGEVRQAIDELVAFIDAREPQLLHYGFYLDEESSRMTVVAVHPDAASVELHMEVGAEAFRGSPTSSRWRRSRSTASRASGCSSSSTRRPRRSASTAGSSLTVSTPASAGSHRRPGSEHAEEVPHSHRRDQRNADLLRGGRTRASARAGARRVGRELLVRGVRSRT